MVPLVAVYHSDPTTTTNGTSKQQIFNFQNSSDGGPPLIFNLHLFNLQVVGRSTCITLPYDWNIYFQDKIPPLTPSHPSHPSHHPSHPHTHKEKNLSQENKKMSSDYQVLMEGQCEVMVTNGKEDDSPKLNMSAIMRDLYTKIYKLEGRLNKELADASTQTTSPTSQTSQTSQTSPTSPTPPNSPS